MSACFVIGQSAFSPFRFGRTLEVSEFSGVAPFGGCGVRMFGVLAADGDVAEPLLKASSLPALAVASAGWCSGLNGDGPLKPKTRCSAELCPGNDQTGDRRSGERERINC